MRKLLLTLCVGIFALASSPVFADEVAGGGIRLPSAERSPWTLNLFGLSRHTQRPTQLNEKNWGLGARYWHGEHWFTEADYVYNSFKGYATTVGTGLDYKLFSLGEYDVHANAQVLFANYSYAGFLHRKSKNGIAIFPGASVNNGPWSAEFTFVPKQSFKKLEVIIFHVGYRF